VSSNEQGLALQQPLLEVEQGARALSALEQEFKPLPTIEQAQLIRLMVQRVDLTRRKTPLPRRRTTSKMNLRRSPARTPSSRCRR
jgi:hypothetical protein